MNSFAYVQQVSLILEGTTLKTKLVQIGIISTQENTGETHKLKENQLNVIHMMGEASQAQATIDHRLLLDYRMQNCVQDVYSKWEQMIYL